MYRGTQVPALAGRYVFGDYSPGADTGKAVGRLFVKGEKYGDPRANTIALPVEGTGNLGLFLLASGTDSDGELYVLGNATGTVTGHTGVVEKLTSS